MYFGFDDTSFVQPLLLYISSACALSNVSLSLSLSLSLFSQFLSFHRITKRSIVLFFIGRFICYKNNKAVAFYGLFIVLLIKLMSVNAEKSDKMISLGYLKYQSVYVFTIMSYTCIYIKTNPTRVWTYKVSIRSFWDICFSLYITKKRGGS